MLDEIITHPYDETYMSASWSHVSRSLEFVHKKQYLILIFIFFILFFLVGTMTPYLMSYLARMQT
jgi:hypothetical protein